RPAGSGDGRTRPTTDRPRRSRGHRCVESVVACSHPFWEARTHIACDTGGPSRVTGGGLETGSESRARRTEARRGASRPLPRRCPAHAAAIVLRVAAPLPVIFRSCPVARAVADIHRHDLSVPAWSATRLG